MLAIYRGFAPFFVQSGFGIWNFHGDKLVHKKGIQFIESLSCNAIFMIFWCSFQTLPRRLMRFNDACVFCYASVGSFATRFPALVVLDLTKHDWFHWPFQLFPRIFLFLWTLPSGSTKSVPLIILALSSFRFSMAHLLAFLFDEQFLSFLTKFLATEKTGLEVAWFFCKPLPDHVIVSQWCWEWFFFRHRV